MSTITRSTMTNSRPEQRKNAHRERCYKLVSLLHSARQDCYVYAALAVVAGQCSRVPGALPISRAICPAGRPGGHQTADPGSGLYGWEKLSRCKQEWGIDVLLPMKKKMDIWEDAWALGKRCPWQEWAAPAPEPKLLRGIVPKRSSAENSSGKKHWPLTRPRNRRPIRPKWWSARRSVRSEALAVGRNVACPSTSCCCGRPTPMATRISGP